MTDGPNLDDRLAQLAARRASASSPHDAEPRVAPKAATRRRHPAAAGRVFAAGLSTSAFLAIVTALSAQQPASGATKVAAAPPRGPVTQPLGTTSLPPTTKAKVVVKTVHHAVYVDQYGRPVSPALVPNTAAARAATSSSSSSASGTTRYVATPSGSPAVGHVTPVQSNPTPSSPTPKPPTTSSPSPPPTSPPVTVHTPPPPPSPPPCTGSKCP